MKNVINCAIVILGVCLVCIGLSGIIFITIQLPVNVYLLIISFCSLVISIIALNKCNFYKKLESDNWEHYLEFIDSMEELKNKIKKLRKK